MNDINTVSQIEKISLKEYIDLKLEGISALFETKIAAQEKAVTLASNTLSIRLDLMNEFRSQLRDQAATFFPRIEHDIYMNKVGDDMKRMHNEHTLFVAKGEHNILHTKLDDDIRLLRESRASLEGKASEKFVAFTMVIAVIGIILSFAALIHAFVDAADKQRPSPSSIIQPTK